MPGAETWINTPRQQLKELQYLETISDIDWLGISPSAVFEAGVATNYILGQDELLFNEQNESKVTAGTMAKLVVNEILAPRHHRERITVYDVSEVPEWKGAEIHGNVFGHDLSDVTYQQAAKKCSPVSKLPIIGKLVD